MMNVPHWAGLLPLAGATLLGLARAMARRRLRAEEAAADRRHLATPTTRAWAELPREEWCPAHDTWHGAEEECPGCREEWESTWATGEGPDDDDDRAAWHDESERLAADAESGWYNDMINRAEFRHDTWRDGR